MSEAQPETVAGREMLRWNSKVGTARGLTQELAAAEQEALRSMLVAIEAEARAAGVARYEAALAQSLHDMLCATHIDSTGCRFNHRMEARRMLGIDAAAPLAEQRDGLDVAVRRLLDTVSAAEALGWNWYDGMKRVKALHPISGDLMSAHANLALAATPSRPAEERT